MLLICCIESRYLRYFFVSKSYKTQESISSSIVIVSITSAKQTKFEMFLLQQLILAKGDATNRLHLVFPVIAKENAFTPTRLLVAKTSDDNVSKKVFIGTKYVKIITAFCNTVA